MKATSTVRAKFLRDGSGLMNTKLWENTDLIHKEFILNLIRFDLEEEPILSFFRNEKYWWLLTNKKMLINNEFDLSVFSLTDIEAVELKELFDGNVTKKECRTIQVLTRAGYTDVQIEGKSWPAIFNLLQFVTLKD